MEKTPANFFFLSSFLLFSFFRDIYAAEKWDDKALKTDECLKVLAVFCATITIRLSYLITGNIVVSYSTSDFKIVFLFFQCHKVAVVREDKLEGKQTGKVVWL